VCFRKMFIRNVFLLFTCAPCIMCLGMQPSLLNFMNRFHGTAISKYAVLSCQKAGLFPGATTSCRMAAIDVTDANFKREVLESNGDSLLL
jgi:hypothetical protein